MKVEVPFYMWGKFRCIKTFTFRDNYMFLIQGRIIFSKICPLPIEMYYIRVDIRHLADRAHDTRGP